MSIAFEELAREQTTAGTITLRRRRELVLDVDVYEVKLDDEFLMSSLFTVAEIELARLGLAAAGGTELDVVVGGLGLGYTARAALEVPGVRSLLVVEAVAEVIGWHERGLLPDTAGLADDPRTTLVHDDFFTRAASEHGFDPDAPARRFDVALVDIDHTPHHHLHPSHALFYTADGLRSLARHLQPHGVFALWSDASPDDDFLALLRLAFATADARVVTFPNFQTGGESTNTIYLAQHPRTAGPA